MNRGKQIGILASCFFQMAVQFPDTGKCHSLMVLKSICHHKILFIIAFHRKIRILIGRKQLAVHHKIYPVTSQFLEIVNNIFKNFPETIAPCHLCFQFHKKGIILVFFDCGDNLFLYIFTVIYHAVVRASATLSVNTGNRNIAALFYRSAFPDTEQYIHTKLSDLLPVLKYSRNLRTEIGCLIQIIKARHQKIVRYAVPPLFCLCTDSCRNIVICTDKHIRKFRAAMDILPHIVHTGLIVVIPT